MWFFWKWYKPDDESLNALKRSNEKSILCAIFVFWKHIFWWTNIEHNYLLEIERFVEKRGHNKLQHTSQDFFL